MLRIERYILEELLRGFGYALGVFVVFFALAGLYELLRNGVPAAAALTLVPYALAYMLPLLIAVASAIACSLAYGRMVADNELLAALASGLHPLVLVRPALFLGLLLATLTYGLQATIAPYAYAQKRRAPERLVQALLDQGDGGARTVTDRRSFALRWERRRGRELFDLELVQVPGGDVGAAPEAEFGRLEHAAFEAWAARAQVVEEPGGRIALRLFDTVVRFFQPRAWSFEELDCDGDGGIEANEWPDGASLVRFDRDGDARLTASEWPPAAAALARRGERMRGAPDTLQLDALTLVVAVRSGTKFRIANLSNRALLAWRARLDRWLEWARTQSETERSRTGARRAAALAASFAAPGAGPIGALAATSLATSAASEQQIGRGLRRRYLIEHALWERITLSSAPLLFVCVAAPLPLVLRSRNWLLALFASASVITASFLVPWMIARQLDDGGYPVPVLFLPPVVLSALIGGVFMWRMVRR